MTVFNKSLTASLSPAASLTRPVMFRLLGAIADSGIDFLGNTYRSVVAPSPASAVAPDGTGAWLSKPNPSKFAVESLYFDQRQNGKPVVIDRLTLTPVTPGIYFTLYYSTDPAGPGSSPGTWDNLLWTPVYQQFQANRTQTYALPRPIVASYVKVEFSMLQPRPYDPGNYQLPVSFQKYPKWVLDYFLTRFAATQRDFLSSSVNITYDALDLAFSYYRDDILTSPDPPPLSQPPTQSQARFFQEQNSSDAVDAQTLAQIRIAFQPYLSQPALLGRLSSVLGSYAASVSTSNYSTEVIQRALGNTSLVSNLQREALLVEKGFPVMFFFVPCRHGYRVSEAVFDHHVAYFAGVKDLVFHREAYSQAADTPQYNEVLADGANLAINDASQPAPARAADRLVLVPSLLG